MARVMGNVKWFNSKKGFGFVSSDQGDIFVHYTALVTKSSYQYLVPGEYVEYDICEVPHKPGSVMASGVTGINRGPLMCESRAAKKTVVAN